MRSGADLIVMGAEASQDGILSCQSPENPWKLLQRLPVSQSPEPPTKDAEVTARCATPLRVRPMSCLVESPPLGADPLPPYPAPREAPQLVVTCGLFRDPC